MTGVARVYGQALYELARDEALAEKIASELAVLRQAFEQNRDFVRLLSSPGISKAERLQIIHDSFSVRVDAYVLNFLKLLTQKGYMNAFFDCCAVYRECYNRDHNILPVKVTTCAPIADAQAQRLREKLSGMTGKQIELEVCIDPACMGGIRLDYDGRQVDDTVRGRLNRLHKMLKNTIL